MYLLMMNCEIFILILFSWLLMHNIVCQIDFIVGREIEVGGIYKGVVTSIKEYGAFVEFNGGQQGLLHISELSHEPVCIILTILIAHLKSHIVVYAINGHRNLYIIICL